MNKKDRIIDDLIVLGKAAPDEIKDGRITICVGGWSNKLGFIRIYPANFKSNLKRWNMVRIPVERNSRDTRKESWKIQGSKSEWQSLHEKIQEIAILTKKEQIKLLENIPKVNCIEDLNEQKLSLGLIKPDEILSCNYRTRDNYNKSVQTRLSQYFLNHYDFLPKTKKNYPMIPVIKWKCPGPCKLKQGYHTSQVITWEIYEWFRKKEVNKKTKKQLWDNLRINDEDYNTWFFVGNQFLYPRSFLIISILRFKKSKEELMKKRNYSLDSFL